jgi:Amt family ammonium transporter
MTAMQGFSGDLLWVLLCAFLVALMQAGFTCLESGMVRAKNSINVALKNLVDFCISFALFGIFGFALMFGPSADGLIGTGGFFLSSVQDSWDMAFFFFEAMFCGTATTIVSGAVAERMRFGGYALTSVVLAGLIYPVIGHWSWYQGGENDPAGWLVQRGFIDFAGSTVVHSVGGWVALAALLIIGPRLGRFGKHGRPVEGHSLPIASLGVFLLWFGWFGFNGGSTLALSNDIPLIVTNTALAGATGGIAGTFVSWLIWGMPLPDRVMNSVIAGLVAITAGCHMVSPVSASLIGFIGGLIALFGATLLERFEIDDAIGAVPAHLFAGIWGTLALALFASEGSLPAGIEPWQQLLIQLEGVTVIGLYAFGLSFVLLKLLNRLQPMRVSAYGERIGLNIAEHGATSSLFDLISQMHQQARSGNFSRPVEVEAETEAEQIATFYNVVLEKFNLETSRRQMAMQKLSQLANYDTLTGLPNRRAFFEALKHVLDKIRRHDRTAAMLYFDLDGFKQVNDEFGHEAGDQVLKEVARRINGCLRDSDVFARLGGDEFALVLDEMNAPETDVSIVAEKVIECIGKPFALQGGSAVIGISIGIVLFHGKQGETANKLVQQADQAMYAAKLSGKGTWYIYDPNDAAFRPAS